MYGITKIERMVCCDEGYNCHRLHEAKGKFSEDVQIHIEPTPVLFATFENPIHRLDFAEAFFDIGFLEGVLEPSVCAVRDERTR